MRDRGQAGKHLCPFLPSRVPLDRAVSLYQLHSLPKSKWKNNHGWGGPKSHKDRRRVTRGWILNKSKWRLETTFFSAELSPSIKLICNNSILHAWKSHLIIIFEILLPFPCFFINLNEIALGFPTVSWSKQPICIHQTSFITYWIHVKVSVKRTHNKVITQFAFKVCFWDSRIQVSNLSVRRKMCTPCIFIEPLYRLLVSLLIQWIEISSEGKVLLIHFRITYSPLLLKDFCTHDSTVIEFPQCRHWWKGCSRCWRGANGLLLICYCQGSQGVCWRTFSDDAGSNYSERDTHIPEWWTQHLQAWNLPQTKVRKQTVWFCSNKNKQSQFGSNWTTLQFATSVKAVFF